MLPTMSFMAGTSSRSSLPSLIMSLALANTYLIKVLLYVVAIPLIINQIYLKYP